MGLIGTLWIDILSFRLSPIDLTDTPRVQLFALGAVALTIVLTIVRLVQTRRASTLLGAVFGLAVIGLAWLGFSTPVDRLFGFAPSGATTIAAYAVHALLALLPLVLVVIWLLQLGRSPLGLRGIGIELAVCALLVVGLETLGWPGDLVAIVEALISVVVFIALAIAGARLIHGATEQRWLRVPYFGLWGAVLMLVLFAHAIQSPLVALCLLFLALVCLDGMAGTGAWRFLVTVPLALAIGILGAANLFAPYAPAPSLSASVWLEAGGAGAVFLLVAALIDWTQQRIARNLTDEVKRVLAEKQAASDLDRARKQRDFAQWLSDQLTGKEAESKAQLAQKTAQEQADEQHLARLTRLARRLVTELDGITAAFFFTMLIAYYLLVFFAANLPDPVPLLRPIAGATLITVAGIVLNQLITRSVDKARAFKAAPDDILRHPIFAPIRKVVAVFLFLVLTLYGLGGQLGSVITQGDCADPGNQSCVLIDQLNSMTHTAGAAPLALLGNSSFWIAMGRIVLGVALVLLALGQLRYVWAVDSVAKAAHSAASAETSASAAATTATTSSGAQPAQATQSSLAQAPAPAGAGAAAASRA